MKTKYLFPTAFRTVGFALALPGFILGYLTVYQNFRIKALDFEISYQDFLEKTQLHTQNFTDEFALTLVISGLSFIAFSRLKHEDELTARLRLDALYWAILINQITYLAAMGFFEKAGAVFGLTENWYLAMYNMFTPLVIFILRYNYLIYYKKDAFLISKLYYLPYFPCRIIAKWISLACIALFLLSLMEIKLVEVAADWVMARLILPLFLLIWAYSKTSDEDELTTKYRLESMQLAVYVNCLLLIVATFTVFGFDFLSVMAINSMSLLAFFVFRFSYITNRNYWQVRREMKGGLLS